MLDIVLKVLSVTGIVLLIVVCIVLVLLLLVLFFPISYRLKGEKDNEKLTFAVKLNWLFGLVRGSYCYPQPGKVIVKLLWFTLYDSAAPSKETEHTASSEKAAKPPMESPGENEKLPDAELPASGENTASKTSESIKQKPEEEGLEQEPDLEPESRKDKGLSAFITTKYEKIKYTIFKIYDKIKHILDNITFYRDLFREEETRALLKHGIERLQKILKNIRPRKLKGNIIFGTGSPDTTGYILAVYSIFSPMYGGYVNITPDFEQTIFLGDFYMAGHITVFQVLFHSLMLVFDKRLKRLNAKIKRHRNQK